MVLLVGLVVLGAVVWLVRSRQGGRTEDTWPGSTPGAVPQEAMAGLAASPIPAESRAAGRIVVRGLTKDYDQIRAVDGLSFTAEPGRITGFLGPNGAGKTTALRMLLGLAEPTAGTATIGGTRYADLADPIGRVGAVLEASGAHPGRSGRDHLRIVCRAAGLPLGRADEVLRATGLSQAARRPAGGYSLGMRQRLGLAAALLGRPQVLVLDEPANGLDPAGIRWLRDLLRAFAAKGGTILISSHILAEMQQLADDVVIIASGHAVARGTVGAVTGSLSKGGTRTLVRTPEPAMLAAELGESAEFAPAGAGAEDVYVTGPDATAIGEAARRAGIAIHQLITQQPDLEAAFLELTRGRGPTR
ncbi:MAG TPA: ATP-binding cassette domain-containing protein [Trebonia sp.]|jgi:ABC-2 type transport system ATP-binding protein